MARATFHPHVQYIGRHKTTFFKGTRSVKALPGQYAVFENGPNKLPSIMDDRDFHQLYQPIQKERTK